jgi:proteasome assembly chaperone (PAC2) family protein
MVIIALLGISFIPACQETATEEDDASAGRKVKLLLHKIGGLEVEIEDLKTRHAKELDMQEKLLAKCNEDRAKLQASAQNNAKDLMNQLLSPMLQENEKLRTENAELKQLIDQLKQK